jgi:RHS repeat-associated protein
MGIQEAFDVQATGFSILAWIKPVANENMGIAGYGDPLPGQAGYALKYIGTTGSEKLQFVLNDGTGSAQTVTYNLPASIYNQWHHVAVTVDPAGAIKLYLDGTQVQSATNQETGTFGHATSAFTVGRVPGASGTPVEFEGYIDDIRVVHTPLTALQIIVAKDNADLTLVNTRSVDYSYDDQNRLLSRVADLDGWVGPLQPTTEYYIHDGNQIVLRLDPDGDVTNRYLWGPNVDQLLADEQVSNPSSAGDVLWALADNLGSVRDLVRFDDVEGVESVVHRVYDSFGNVTKETNAVDVLFGFTGRQFDGATGLQNNLNRWYDASVGRWISEDPIGFAGGDANLYRYVANGATNFSDPLGLWRWDDDWIELGLGGLLGFQGQEVQEEAGNAIVQNPLAKGGMGGAGGAIGGGSSGAIGGGMGGGIVGGPGGIAGGAAAGGTVGFFVGTGVGIIAGLNSDDAFDAFGNGVGAGTSIGFPAGFGTGLFGPGRPGYDGPDDDWPFDNDPFDPPPPPPRPNIELPTKPCEPAAPEFQTAA